MTGMLLAQEIECLTGVTVEGLERLINFVVVDELTNEVTDGISEVFKHRHGRSIEHLPLQLKKFLPKAEVGLCAWPRPFHQRPCILQAYPHMTDKKCEANGWSARKARSAVHKGVPVWRGKEVDYPGKDVCDGKRGAVDAWNADTFDKLMASTLWHRQAWIVAHIQDMGYAFPSQL